MSPSPPRRSADSKGRDSLALARLGFWTAILSSLLALSFLGIDIFLRCGAQAKPAALYMETLALPAPALMPAGTALRRPEGPRSRLDLRFSPWVPRQLDPAAPDWLHEEPPDRRTARQ